MKASSQTTTRGGIGRWLVEVGSRFRRHGEFSAPADHFESQVALLQEAAHPTYDSVQVTRLLEQILHATLHDTGATIGTISTIDATNTVDIINTIINTGDAIDETETKLVIRAAICTGEPTPLPALRGLEGTIEGQVFRSCEPYSSTSAVRKRGGAGVAAQHFVADLQHGEAILCVPLLERAPDVSLSRALGVLTLRHTRAGMTFSASDCRIARQAAGLVAGALANAHAIAARKRSAIATLQNIVISLEGKDPSTMNHSYRVTEVCGLLAAQTNLDVNIVQELRIGAMLHDIGKIGVPAGVLNKPGNLTDEELALLKQYPIMGYNLCKPLDLGEEIMLLIRNHAEKLDGTGYPDRLRQGQLPLPLRILCVADAFDAMSSYRPYRKALDARERNEQLNRFAGTQFDPTVVEILKSLLNSGRLDEVYRDQWQLSAETQQPYQLALAA